MPSSRAPKSSLGTFPSMGTRSVATLSARGLCHEIGGRTVLDAISLTVSPTSCIGVVGPNGVGKSTLLRLLAGLEAPDEGSVRFDPPTATIGYLAQEHQARPGESVRHALTRHVGVEAAELELAAAAKGLATGTHTAEQRYVVALERHQALSAGGIDARIDATLADLGLDLGPGAHTTIADKPMAVLSGGEASRVALAAVILSRFDITLLDEPTNDLDFDGLERLEKFVASRTGGMVIVSHDRTFLDRTVTSVLELRDHDHSGQEYGGGWAAYLAERETAHRHASEEYAVYDARRQDLKSRAQRERQWATTGVAKEKRSPRDNDKVQRNFRIDRTEQLAGRARRSERALATLAEVEKPWEGWDLHFSIGQAPRSGTVVVRLDDAVIRRGEFSLGPLSVEIGWADRVALTGPNGSGKSSLVQALLGRLPLATGAHWMGPGVVVGELGQSRRVDHHTRTVVESVVSRCGLTDSEVRSLLAKFGLGADHVTRPHASLSPGERTRAELAIFQAQGVNFLVLDEPTNHLDVPAIEQLETALAGFGGTVLLVTHDRRLLDSVELGRRIELG